MGFNGQDLRTHTCNSDVTAIYRIPDQGISRDLKLCLPAPSQGVRGSPCTTVVAEQ